MVVITPSSQSRARPRDINGCTHTFIENGDNEDRRLIKAKTTDNPYLPEGFIDSLYQNYDPNLIASYVNGDFTNLTAVTVYHPFDRDKHYTDEQIRDDERIFVGIDFNVNACFLKSSSGVGINSMSCMRRIRKIPGCR